jgi:adenylylsulfate kinase
MNSSNTVWHQGQVTRAMRERSNGHRAAVVWFTGLSGAGKSTLAHAVEDVLWRRGCRAFVLDGDNVRHGLCGDLGFSVADRTENIRRIGEVSRLFFDAGMIAMTAFISPLREDRARVQRMFAPGEFIEIFCDASVAECEARDVKGLYRRARSGEVPEFTGISSPYEAPTDADLVLQTGHEPLEDCVARVLALLEARRIVPLAAG